MLKILPLNLFDYCYCCFIWVLQPFGDCQELTYSEGRGKKSSRSDCKDRQTAIDKPFLRLYSFVQTDTNDSMFTTRGEFLLGNDFDSKFITGSFTEGQSYFPTGSSTKNN